MKSFNYFLVKLTCALMTVIILRNFIFDESLSIIKCNSQVVYAQKSKQTSKNSKTKVVTGNHWRWQKPRAKVYIDLNDNPDMISATNDAISAWNRTKVFTFSKTKNKKKADITISQVYHPYTNYAGFTTFQYYLKTGFLYEAAVNLNIYYLQNFSNYYYNYERIVNTVEHELGHAIGLKHNNIKKSVMYPAQSLYPIEPIDIANAKKLYHK
ncbi:matrixin family metalloprotease [Lactobacillus bombicola]|uniref:Metalloprotease n=1 Tax=Lactobacillus bombicola TaxID=1505723 RepID=A0A396T2S1_9LACO|nr:matrixin family metalloprotease [Lactobacillus bombicola]RHW53214.1 metalloprotease [Lactobacillus bombicola]RHW55170.1 metalloprotease [Lactobacillus bombicola]